MQVDPSEEPRVAHLDMDAFYVSVELLRHPELRGQPVVVAGSGPRAVVTTASYEARRFGVGSAIPASRARRLCPQAVFLAPDFSAYRAASKQVMDLVRGHVERVEVVGLDEAYLDLEGLYSPRAAMRRLVALIEQRTGLHASVGIGPNKLVAKVASDAEKPRGFVVLTREEARARFAKAPPGLIPGIGPKTAGRLEALGARTLAQVRALPDGILEQTFGANHGRDLRRRASFEHDGTVGAPPKVVSESRERTFDRDISDHGLLEQELARMCEQLCASLAAKDRRGRTIGIKVRLDNFSTYTRARSIPRPTGTLEIVREVALDLLRANPPARPVRLLGVRLAGLSRPSGEDPREDARDAEAAAGSPVTGSSPGAPGGTDQLALPM